MNELRREANRIVYGVVEACARAEGYDCYSDTSWNPHGLLELADRIVALASSGFSWADVDFLQGAADDADASDLRGGDADSLRDVAERIAERLQPRLSATSRFREATAEEVNAIYTSVEDGGAMIPRLPRRGL